VDSTIFDNFFFKIIDVSYIWKNRKIEGGFEDFLKKKNFKILNFVQLLIFHIFLKNRQIEGGFDDFLTKNFKIPILSKKNRQIEGGYDNFRQSLKILILQNFWKFWKFLYEKNFVKWKIIPHFNKLSRFFQRFFKINNSLVLVQAVPRVLLGTPQVSSTSFSKVQFRMLY